MQHQVRAFASDNYAGVHPEVMAAIAEANGGHVTSYGDDPYTERLGEVMRSHFGEQAQTFPVFNGSGANVVSLMAMTDRWDAVICTETSHINVDECGAPEKLGAIKLLPVEAPDGKLTPELIDRKAWGFGDAHHAQPAVVSLTQGTELGTVYTPDEIAAVTEHADSKGMVVHVDGARIANAAAGLGLPLRAFTTDVGVDVLSVGGTKNGAMGAEAVVVLNPGTVRGVDYVRKLSAQLASKMRFISAQLIALYDGDLWQRSAEHANAMAARLAVAVQGLDGVRITQQTQANAVFAVLSRPVAERLRERFRFYDWNAATGEVRWMCAFDTTENDVDAFVAALREELAR
ncbi:threonine aldolase [Epidermidibacterium keratini]|uniref:Threonine aldolase n=1 Tax=Epidermidibacterium keratini TaxID=1891644 RepID=A0A7L4YQ65_9ACTN|nr:low specificity L-threonine aldolase [Epidermidibacterium keratini]QHC01162.1 threonine aldolase [Epidermidibacterium keratini]